MSFTDIFKKSFLSGYASTHISPASILLCMAITLAIAVYIYAFYRMVNRNAFYNKNFNISLVALAALTAAIILTLQSNIVISLGMVGALSIVRFRTAIKDPLDLVFLFWSISVGIICGAGFAMIAVIASVLVSIIILVLSAVSVANPRKLLLINADSLEAKAKVQELLTEYCVNYQVKSSNLKRNRMDLVVEVQVKEEDALLKELMQTEGVFSASLLSHDGEVTF